MYVLLLFSSSVITFNVIARVLRTFALSYYFRIMGRKLQNAISLVDYNNLNNNVQQTGNGLPRSPTSSERILSNSSASPRHEGKKSMTFTQPNRFAVQMTPMTLRPQALTIKI